LPYVELPITDDADTLVQRAKDSLSENGWTPNDGDPEVVILEAVGLAAESVAEIAADMPSAAFREAGRTLFGIPYLTGAPAEATVTFTLGDTDGQTIPANTYVQIGDFYFATVDDATAEPGAASIDNVLVRCSEDGAAGNGLTGPTKLVNSLARVNSVSLVGVTSGGADPESDEAYQDRLVRLIQTMALRPITAGDYAVMAQSVPGVAVGRATAINAFKPEHNLLTVNQSSVETDTTGLAATGGSLTRDTDEHTVGLASLKLTSSSGTYDIHSLTGTDGIPVTPGARYVFRTDLKLVSVGGTSRSLRIGLHWYTDGGSHLSASARAYTVASGSWNDPADPYTFVTTAPATAAFVAIEVLGPVLGGSSGDVIYVDGLKLGLSMDSYDGANVGPLDKAYVPGDTDAFTNPRTVAVIVADAEGIALSADDKDAIASYLQARREPNFIVNVLDPIYNRVGVAYTLKLYPGYDKDAVLAAIDTALRGYVNPATWGITSFGVDNDDWLNETRLRVNKLVQIILNVPGVDYVDSVYINGSNSNLLLAGYAPLPILPQPIETTMTFSGSSTTLTVPSTEGLYPYMLVVEQGDGSHIQTLGTTDTRITSVDHLANTVEINLATVGSGTDVPVLFTPVKGKIING